MSDFTSKPPNQNQQSDHGGATYLPRDVHWATMVSLYPDDFNVAEHQEAQEVLECETNLSDVEEWSLVKVRAAQERPYVLPNEAPVLSDIARSKILEAAKTAASRHQARYEADVREASLGSRFERWFAPLISQSQAFVWTAVVGLALIGLWTYQAELESSRPLPYASDTLSDHTAPEGSLDTSLEREQSNVDAKDKKREATSKTTLPSADRRESEPSPISDLNIRFRGDASGKTPSMPHEEMAEERLRKVDDVLDVDVAITAQSKAPTPRPQSRTRKSTRARSKKQSKRTQNRASRRSRAKPKPSKRRPPSRSRRAKTRAEVSTKSTYAPPPPLDKLDAPSLKPSAATRSSLALDDSLDAGGDVSSSKSSRSSRSVTTRKPQKRSRAQINRVIRRNRHTLKACHALSDDSVTVRWLIRTSGEVTAVKVISSPNSQALTQCLINQMKRWRFATSSTQQSVTHTFSLGQPELEASPESF